MVEKAVIEIADVVVEEGKRAMIESGVDMLPSEIIKLLRKIKIQNKLWTKCSYTFNRSCKSCKYNGRTYWSRQKTCCKSRTSS